jgi:hypothetical protein
MTITNLRIDSEVYGKLKEIAKEENRSINNMLVCIIMNYLKDREA